MAGKRTVIGDVAIEYLKNFPNHSKLALARMMAKENPSIFKDVETARSVIRQRTGAMGERQKRYTKDIVEHSSGHSRENPFGFPASHEEKREPYILPKANNNILIISDLHIPYHTIEAVNCAIKYGLDNKVNTIFINGDLMDFYMFSRFEKDPRKRSAKDEIEAGKEFLATLRRLFPNAGIYYHLGNHDTRYEKWLMSHPEVFGDPYFELETRLELIKQRIHLIGDKQITKAGKLSIHHGHYIFRSATSPVSPARTILLKAKKSMICGHTHKISEATGIDLDGDIITTWSSGSLCELTPDYTPMCNDYSHGFAHAIIKEDSFTLKNFRIHRGKIL